jgi:hypothetical protein
VRVKCDWTEVWTVDVVVAAFIAAAGTSQAGAVGKATSQLLPIRQNWAEIAAGVLADRAGNLSTVMHWVLVSSQHLLDDLIIEHGSCRAIAFFHGRRAGDCGGAP